MLRFLEICGALEVSAPALLNQALQRARVDLANLVLVVDLRRLVTERDEQFRSMVVWAHNKLVKCPDGVVEVTPSAVVELADLIGCSAVELADYLAGFVPDHADAEVGVG
ncbi:MAG: hypothetical protein WBA97_08315 [Actinophytocola sp.]|uniref:hypothetical protein n=1 Tax=Actinophytocola sp. TaxID=1872138 RepID=UPI003C7957A6